MSCAVSDMIGALFSVMFIKSLTTVQLLLDALMLG